MESFEPLIPAARSTATVPLGLKFTVGNSLDKKRSVVKV